MERFTLALVAAFLLLFGAATAANAEEAVYSNEYDGYLLYEAPCRDQPDENSDAYGNLPAGTTLLTYQSVEGWTLIGVHPEFNGEYWSFSSCYVKNSIIAYQATDSPDIGSEETPQAEATPMPAPAEVEPTEPEATLAPIESTETEQEEGLVALPLTPPSVEDAPVVTPIVNRLPNTGTGAGIDDEQTGSWRELAIVPFALLAIFFGAVGVVAFIWCCVAGCAERRDEIQKACQNIWLSIFGIYILCTEVASRRNKGLGT